MLNLELLLDAVDCSALLAWLRREPAPTDKLDRRHGVGCGDVAYEQDLDCGFWNWPHMAETDRSALQAAIQTDLKGYPWVVHKEDAR